MRLLHGRFAILGTFLAVLALSSSIIGAHGVSSYTPGVKQGQWAKYKLLKDSCNFTDPMVCQGLDSGGLHNADYGLLQIASVLGHVVEFTIISVYQNGTSSRQGISADVFAGTINASSVGMTSNADFFVLAANLTTTDPIWGAGAPNTPMFNSTSTENILGVPRDVNFLNHTATLTTLVYSYSSTLGYVFDKISGLFIELSVSFSSTGAVSGKFDLDLVMVDNNIWFNGNLPNYTLSASPTTVSIAGGATGTATIAPARSNGFSANIALGETPSSSGLSCSLSRDRLVSGTYDSSVLSCTGSPGSYVVTVHGNGSYVIRTVAVNVNIVAGPDFTIKSNGDIGFQTGTSGTTRITITATNGYNSATTLEASSSPPGLTCNLSNTSVSGSGSVTLTCSGQPGTYVVTVKATGGGTSHSSQTTVTVSSAAASTQPASPLSIPLIVGGAVAVAVVFLLSLLLLRRRPKATATMSGTPTQA